MPLGRIGNGDGTTFRWLDHEPLRRGPLALALIVQRSFFAPVGGFIPLLVSPALGAESRVAAEI